MWHAVLYVPPGASSQPAAQLGGLLARCLLRNKKVLWHAAVERQHQPAHAATLHHWE